MATHYRTCPFCEATCGLEIETEGREVVSVRGDADDVFSHGFICPKAYGVKQLHEDPDRLTTPLVRRDGELVEASWDEAFEEIDRRLAPLIAEHGKNAVAVYLGNPNAHNLSALIHGPAWLRVLGIAEHLHGVDRRPDAEAGVGRADVRDDPVGPDPGRRPLRPPAAARREPARLERQPAHRARHARAAARRSASAAARSSWWTRAGHAPPRRRTSTTSSSPAPTRCCSPRWPARSSRRGSTSPGALDGAPERARRGADAGARLPAGGRGRRLRGRGRGDPSNGARAGGRRARRRVRAHRHLHAGVRHPRELARGRAERAHREPRPRGRRPVHARRGRARRTPPGAAPGAPPTFGRWTQPRARAAGAVRRAARCRAGGGDRHPRRGPGARAHHGRRQSAPLDPEQRPARGRGRGPRLHALDRHLRERDDPPRGRDPARARAAREGALRPRASTSSPRATSRTTRRRSSSARARPSGRSSCGSRA